MTLAGIRRLAATTTVLLSFVTAAASAQMPPDLIARSNAVVDALVAGEFAKISADYDEKMKAAMPDDKLAGIWKSLPPQFGAFRRRLEPKVEEQAGFRIVTVPCEFELATLNLNVVFNAGGKIAGFSIRPAAPPTPYAPPPYVDPSKFTEQEVTFGYAPWVLPGTLAMPVGAGPFPAVILVHGSGPNDRDETIGPNKPFKDIALGLASRGIAVLRYEKRTRKYAAAVTRMTAPTVKEEVIYDVVAAAAFLRTTTGIDPKRVIAAGHSLGGMLIPRIAETDPQFGGLIVLAGPAESLEEAFIRQTRYLAEADGTVSPDEQKQIDNIAAMAAAVRNLDPATRATAAPIAGVPASYWLDLRGYDPPSASLPLRQPMLVLQGERDYQVTMDSFAKWKAALAQRPNVTFHSYPALNHLFIAGEGKSLPVEYTRAGHVSEDVIRDIAAWITAHVK